MTNKITTEGLAQQIANLLHDKDFVLASRERYEALLDDAAGEVMEVVANRMSGTNIFFWDENLPLLWNIELRAPLEHAEYWISPMQRRLIGTGDSRPSVVLVGLPVDMLIIRRTLLAPMTMDDRKATRYLEIHGLHKNQIDDSERMLNKLIETGVAV